MVGMGGLMPEQRALIPEYQAKWGRIVRSRQPIDRMRATEGIQEAYGEIGRIAPEIQFFDSPIAANRWIERCEQLSSFVVQFDLSACMFNFTSFVMNSQSPLGTPQSLEKMPFTLLFDPVMSLPGMKNFAKEISNPLLRHITTIANEQSVTNPLAPIGNQFAGKLTQGIAQGVLFNQQQALRRSVLEQPWGEFLIRTGDSLWQTLRPITQPLETEVEKISSYLGTEVWKQVQAQPQMQQWLGLLSRFWNNPTQFDEVYGWMIDWMPAIDFSVNVLKEDFGIEHWSANVKLRQECFWVYPFEQVCLVIDRPMQYSFDADRELHGEPAIVFRDGTSISAEHGKVLF
jgi:hypothetical protein